MIQQPYNLFKPAKVTPESFEHQGVQQPPQQISQPAVQAPDVMQMAAEAEQMARQTQQMPVSQPSQPAQTTSSKGNTRSINPNSETEGIDYLASLLTTPDQEEKYRKASVANQRILAIGDALRHIGNIANTVNYAPSQQFTNPVVEEEQRYQKGKALRDAANLKYYTYQQAKAAQDQKARQWEAQMKYNMEKDAREFQLKKSESEARNNLREAQLNRYQTMMALDEARREGIISDNEYKKRKAELYPSLVQSQIARNNRTGGGRSGGGSRSGGSNMPDYDVVTTYERDDEGRVKSAKKTRTVKHSDGTTSTSTKTTKPQKKALPGQTQTQPQKKTKKRLPGM